MSDLLSHAFRLQAEWCQNLGSPFTAGLLLRVAADIDQGGPTAALLGDRPCDPASDALPLRFAGALHAIALEHPDSELAACYPPHSNDGKSAALWRAITQTLDRQHAVIADFLTRPPQTNEVRRSAVLLGGFLEIAARTRLKLRLVEIGASAGLNQLWDRYHYRLGDGASWGDPAAAASMAADWSGPLPRLEAPVMIASRSACDASPIDLEDAQARRRLRAYIWADQSERLALQAAAVGAARAARIQVVEEDAADFVDREFRHPVGGEGLVLYHSIMWQYLPAETQARIRARMAQAGAAATIDSPVAWLCMEPNEGDVFVRHELRLTLWPPGTTETLAECHPHGAFVHWLGGLAS